MQSILQWLTASGASNKPPFVDTAQRQRLLVTVRWTEGLRIRLDRVTAVPCQDESHPRRLLKRVAALSMAFLAQSGLSPTDALNAPWTTFLNHQLVVVWRLWALWHDTDYLHTTLALFLESGQDQLEKFLKKVAVEHPSEGKNLLQFYKTEYGSRFAL